MSNEADTCRKHVVPLLQQAGWDNEPHSMAEQRCFIDGRIVVHGTAAQAGLPDADPVEKQQAAFNYLGPEARETLDDLLEKYATDGELQFTLPDVLKVPPLSQSGNVKRNHRQIRGHRPTPQCSRSTAIFVIFGVSS